MIQFSKNRSESRFNEEEFSIFQNRNYSFQLSYDERLVDLRWFNLFAKSGDLNQQQFASSLSSIESQSAGLRSSRTSNDPNKPKPKAVIATNQRICIVDRNLGILQNYSLVQQHTRLVIRNLALAGESTVLFATDNHLHYLTQERANSSETECVSPSGIIMSFN